jgi:hypothetical protein
VNYSSLKYIVKRFLGPTARIWNYGPIQAGTQQGEVRTVYAEGETYLDVAKQFVDLDPEKLAGILGVPVPEAPEVSAPPNSTPTEPGEPIASQ